MLGKPIEKAFRVGFSDGGGSLSQVEIQFIKLLESSEALVSEGTFSGQFDSRLGPFLRRLEGLLHKMGEDSERHEEFSQKLRSLKNFVEEDQLFDFDYDLPDQLKKRSMSSKGPQSTRRIIPPPPPLLSMDDNVQKEIFRKTVERYRAQDRKELFEDHSTTRKRRTGVDEKSNPQSLIHGQEVAQEEIAEQMLSLTKSLKEQTEAANRIIHRDISSLEGTRRTVDENNDKLTVESNRLQEHRSTFNCRCWIWILMFIVVMTFLKMLVVMKLFKKPS